MDRDASWEREHPRGVDPDEGLAGSLRDAPPDPFAPIDPGAPVSGHIPAPEAAGHPGSHAPEQEWSVAAGLIVPALRPVGTQGVPLSEIDPDALAESAGKTHTQPLLEEGPCGLAVVYAMAGGGFDVIVLARTDGRGARHRDAKPRRVVGQGTLDGRGLRGSPAAVVRHGRWE